MGTSLCLFERRQSLYQNTLKRTVVEHLVRERRQSLTQGTLNRIVIQTKFGGQSSNIWLVGRNLVGYNGNTEKICVPIFAIMPPHRLKIKLQSKKMAKISYN